MREESRPRFSLGRAALLRLASLLPHTTAPRDFAHANGKEEKTPAGESDGAPGGN